MIVVRNKVSRLAAAQARASPEQATAVHTYLRYVQEKKVIVVDFSWRSRFTATIGKSEGVFVCSVESKPRGRNRWAGGGGV